MLLIISAGLSAQPDTSYTPARLYPADSVKADMLLLRSVLEEAHPSLYRYTSKDTLDHLFAAAQQRLNGPLTEIACWNLLEPLVAAIRSGHTELGPSAAYIRWCNQHMVPMLPFSVFAGNDKLYIAGHAKGVKLPYTGAEITSIDGTATPDLLEKLKVYMPAEGRSSQFTRFLLSTREFALYYGLIYGFNDQVRLELTNTGGTRRSITLDNVPQKYGHGLDEGRGRLAAMRDSLSEAVKVTFPPEAPATAVLQIKHFTYANVFRSFDEKFFKQLQDNQTRHLIIDLRGNTGGYANIGLDMMGYLVKGICHIFNNELSVTDTLSFSRYILPASSENFSQYKLIKVHKRLYELKGGNYYYRGNPDYHYDNDLIVLIDRASFSAVTLFAASLKEQRRLTFMGEESGGGEAGTDGGGFSIVQLPHTHLLLRLPQFWLSSTTRHANQGNGIKPDISIIPTIADRLGKTDRVMEAALQLIKKSETTN